MWASMTLLPLLIDSRLEHRPSLGCSASRKAERGCLGEAGRLRLPPSYSNLPPEGIGLAEAVVGDGGASIWPFCWRTKPILRGGIAYMIKPRLT